MVWDVILPRSIESDLHDHAHTESHEVCGLLSGIIIDDKQMVLIDDFTPINNIAKDPNSLFIMDPLDQLQCYDNVINGMRCIVGCFHTHPNNLGNPSGTDAQMINENYSWLIWGGADDVIRAWYPEDYRKPKLGFEPANLIITRD